MTLSILPYKPDYQPYFDRYNRAWIAKYFFVEPIDELVLSNPDEHIIQKGGELWFAEMNGKIVGCYAMIARDDGNFEFSKLGIAPEAKGQKLGQKLLHHAYARAKERGAERLIIYTHSSLKTACELYEQEGFVPMQVCASEKNRYARCDTLLERTLGNTTVFAESA
ncbi:MAG: GNAT family N-acetyltransferase [Alphaproteobacteria bacterium]|nr:GNAT family N-acetyltransferase [Alphaproteobacteria bacterium]